MKALDRREGDGSNATWEYGPGTCLRAGRAALEVEIPELNNGAKDHEPGLPVGISDADSVGSGLAPRRRSEATDTQGAPRLGDGGLLLAGRKGPGEQQP